MSKKYHLDQNNAAFIHCVNSAFAGMYMWAKLIEEKGNKIPKKKLIEAFQSIISQTNTAVVSEYIRGELIKKGILEDGDDTGLCTFDPSVDNENSEAEVYTVDELDANKIGMMQSDWENNVKGK